MAPTWFLDRTHACRETGRQLRKAGIAVVKHRYHVTQIQRVGWNDLSSPASIGVDRGTIFDVLENGVLQGFALYIRYDLSANLTHVAVKEALHNRLALVAFRHGLNAATFVHVDGFPADVGLVYFALASRATANLATKVRFLHGFANAVEHEPCCVLPNAENLAQFIAADSVLAVRQHPKSENKPENCDFQHGEKIRIKVDFLPINLISSPLTVVLRFAHS